MSKDSSKGLCFASAEEHLCWLERQAALPVGFRVATSKVPFRVVETGNEAQLSLTLLTLDATTESVAGLFTQNAFVGAPVVACRKRLAAGKARALVVNTKVSNVGVASGLEDSERIAAAAAEVLGCDPLEVFPASTGVIGWRLPLAEIVEALSSLQQSLQQTSVLPAAQAIMTTDLYPKIRRADLGGGSIVAIAKGAGMIEPNLATMLVFVLSDIAISASDLQAALREAAQPSFNSISVDSDQSTSDMCLAFSSNRVKGVGADDFAFALDQVCRALARDVVRNGEGVRHVIEVSVAEAPSEELARRVGKSIINSPLVKTAIAGNDPNVGRLAMAVGKGLQGEALSFEGMKISIGDWLVFENGVFVLTSELEAKLADYLKSAELYASNPPDSQGVFSPARNYPAHEQQVRIRISLAAGSHAATVWGGDLTHEYVSENADYRS